jgi:DNA-binding winged helix-turn-helix (wHTH) protein
MLFLSHSFLVRDCVAIVDTMLEANGIVRWMGEVCSRNNVLDAVWGGV